MKVSKIDEAGFSATLIRQIGIGALENIVTKKIYFILIQILYSLNFPR